MNTGKIERAAVRAVEEYIDRCPRLEPVLQSNDKTPIWDGEIYVYGKERHKVEDFSAIVHLQIKGSASAKGNFYRIDRAYVEAYKADRGCVFLLHQQREGSSKLLYAILSVKQIDALLQQSTKTIKIDLKEIPTNPLDFQKELIAFAEERNGKRIENTSPKEIESLIEYFNDIKQHLDEVEDNGVRYELESYLNTILGLRNDGTVGWRDKFIYLARKVLDLTLQHIKDYDALDLQFKLAIYLDDQKIYHVAENYYLQALKKYRKRAKADPIYKADVAKVQNLLGNLHTHINKFNAAEAEYKEALEIRRKLAEDNPDAYLLDVVKTLNNFAGLYWKSNKFDAAANRLKEALEIFRRLPEDSSDAYLFDFAMSLNNLGNLYSDIHQFRAAEVEYNMALEIFRKLAENKPSAFLAYVAGTLNNLGILHIYFNQQCSAVTELKEALEIRKKLAEDNPDVYLPDVAGTLINLGNLHDNLNQQSYAETEYKEALVIYRKLAENNPEAYLAYVATALSNLAGMFWKVNQFDAAFSELKEALEIRKKLAEDNPDVYLPDVATSLCNMALLLIKDTQRTEEAKQVCQEALDIFKVMAEKAPQRFNKDVKMAQRRLDEINELLQTRH